MVRMKEKRWQKKNVRKLKKCCENYMGSKISDYVTRLKITVCLWIVPLLPTCKISQ